MPGFDELKDKAQQVAEDHPDQAEKLSDQALEHGGDAADKVSGGKHSEQLDSLQEKADDKIGD